MTKWSYHRISLDLIGTSLRSSAVTPIDSLMSLEPLDLLHEQVIQTVFEMRFLLIMARFSCRLLFWWNIQLVTVLTS